MTDASKAIVIYKRKDGIHFEVTLKNDTIWLSQAQIGNVFVVKKAAVSKHIKNIFADGELAQRATVSKMETVQREGGRLIKRNIEYYNLDMIIAIGYRVNSVRATQFRIWATGVLKDHLIKGATAPTLQGMDAPKKLAPSGTQSIHIDPASVEWDKVASGVFRKDLAHDQKRDLVWSIFKIDPGASLQRHRHPNWEWVYVIDGVYEDEYGSVPKGHMKINADLSVHTSRSLKGCTLLVVWCGRHDSV